MAGAMLRQQVFVNAASTRRHCSARPAQQHRLWALRGAVGGPGVAAGHPVSLPRLSAVRASADGGASTKAQDAMHQLDVLKQEAAAAKKLRAELEARTAAADNLQAQLQALEELRATELADAANRFAEFEEALSVAEKSIDLMDNTGERVQALEAELAKKDAALVSVRRDAALLQLQLQQHAIEEGDVPASSKLQQLVQENKALQKAVEQKDGEIAELRSQVDALERQLAAAGSASSGKGGGVAAAPRRDSELEVATREELRQLRQEVAALQGSELQKISDLQEAAEVAQVLADQIDKLTQELEVKTTEVANWQRQAAAAESAAADADAERQEVLEQQEELQQLLAEKEQDLETNVSIQANLAEQLQLLQDQVTIMRQRLVEEEELATEALRSAEEAERAAAEEAARGRELRAAAAAEAAQAEGLLARAEEAAEAVGRQLLEVMGLRQEVQASREAIEAQTKELAEAQARAKAQEERARANGKKKGSGQEASGLLMLSEEDAEVLLDELELMRAELAQEQQASSTLTARASAAEAEAATLRSHLMELASAKRVVDAAGLPSDDELRRSVAEAQQAVAAAEAEAEALAVENLMLQEELERVQAELAAAAARAAAAAAADASPVATLLPGVHRQQKREQRGRDLAAALARAEELERQNAELRVAAAQREAVLTQSRKFLEGYLQRAAETAEAAAAAAATAAAGEGATGGGGGVDAAAGRAEAGAGAEEAAEEGPSGVEDGSGAEGGEEGKEGQAGQAGARVRPAPAGGSSAAAAVR